MQGLTVNGVYTTVRPNGWIRPKMACLGDEKAGRTARFFICVTRWAYSQPRSCMASTTELIATM